MLTELKKHGVALGRELCSWLLIGLFAALALSCRPADERVEAQATETARPSPLATNQPSQEPQGFVPPDTQQRLRALGDLEQLSAELKAVFTPSPLFPPIPEPEPDDWLANHAEPGQSYNQYLLSRPNLPVAQRQTICLLPLGAFTEEAPSLQLLEEFSEIFFGLPVEVLEPVNLLEAKVATRVNEFTDNEQLLTDDLLSLLKNRLPEQAYCLLGITMNDLYPGEDWNFVFGIATLTDRVGIYSFARYDPAFFGSPREADWERVLLSRSLKVLAHETGHMFAMAHCIYFDCLMNGSNHLAESDRQPLTLCPICLRKLHHAVGFKPKERYQKLVEFYERAGLTEPALQLEKRLDELN